MAESTSPNLLSTGITHAVDSHVHFSQDQLSDHTADIVVKEIADGELEVHLGFLQIQHKYQIKFSVTNDLGQSTVVQNDCNVNVQVTSLAPSSDGNGHDLEVTLWAYKEKLMKENVTLCNRSGKKLVVVLFARVMGKGKGKPSLRNNIHCIKSPVPSGHEVNQISQS